ncbi:packaged DNA stabilization protein [Stenotrophomonas sp. UBA7606]|uniref:packaged DNA stabilization protein n=1 Tax=Stenotrophomonas sp. UBA7606 TaxID=1947559 RepID=UPI0025E29DCE|nr:packaged DNA stabilization protein [Stenotrophomonas sp. UBA7606]
MPLTRVNLLAGFNRDDSPAWSVQDVCNFLPVVADQPGTKTQFKLRTPPGLKPYQRISPGPIRGVHNAEGRLFVVSGQTLYEVTAKGVGISRGTIPGVGRVRMAHNQVKNGNQLAVVNGQSGYIYNTATQAFTRITDDGFPGAIDVKFIDGYLFYLEPFGRFWLHSDLADGLSYNTLDRGEAESQPDRLVGLAVNQGEVILFGERTTEFYGNTGEATGTFHSKGVTADVGCASRDTVQNLDNSVMWLGNDGVVYRLDGYRAVPISTRAIEKTIAASDWKNAFAFTWEDEGHKVYYITFPDGETYGYDVVVGLWHRRQSFGLKRWRLNTVTSWGRKWIGGDFQDGRLWLLDWDYVLEGDDELIATYTSAEISDSGNRIGIPEMNLEFDVGRKQTVPVPFPAEVTP